MSIEASVIIRSYNEQKHIGRLLQGLVSQKTDVEFEIILVDSGSNDSTVEIAKLYKVKVIHITPEEFSFGRALNFGCDAASGRFLIFVSAHVFPVCDDWLNRMLAHFLDSSVGLVYGKQIGNEVTKYSEHQIFASWFPSESNLNQESAFCNNANAAIRKELWKQCKYDESITGLEDLDWATKIKKLGFKIVYDAKATIVHVHEENYRAICNRYRREAIALKNIFPQESMSIFEFITLLVANIVSDLAKAFKESVLRKEFYSIIRFRIMQFWGTYRGFSQKGSPSMNLKQKFYYPKLQLHNEETENLKINKIDYKEISQEKNG